MQPPKQLPWVVCASERLLRRGNNAIARNNLILSNNVIPRNDMILRNVVILRNDVILRSVSVLPSPPSREVAG